MKEKRKSEMKRHETLKRIIRQLHDGISVEDVKREFGNFLASCTPLEISQIEEELIKEGMPVEEIRALCDVHLATFEDALKSTHLDLEPSHPVWILMQEHNLLLKNGLTLHEIAKKLAVLASFESADPHWPSLKDLLTKFRESENHYLREENVLFPFLEKHGVTQPPKIMWAEHDEIRALKKQLYTIVDSKKKLEYKQFTSQLGDIALAIAEKLASHFQKENNILFPTALKVIQPNEWIQIRHEFDDIGYSFITPDPFLSEKPETRRSEVDAMMRRVVQFETGALSYEVLQGIFNSLPVDITFVDKDDKVQFYSESGGRVFVRTKAVIGRSVQACHPQKSLHKVQQILDDFRAGKRKTADFWINLKGRFIYIRYFAVHDNDGNYIGCLEVTQDVTSIRALEGEKRLLD